MPDDPRVDQLLEELLDSGGTPEDACRACPELLPDLWELADDFAVGMEELLLATR